MSVCMKAPGMSTVATSWCSLASIVRDSITDSMATVGGARLLLRQVIALLAPVGAATSLDETVAFLLEEHEISQ
jgi:hypothetical protein